MDQLGFLGHCATALRVAGVELQDIHFPQTRPAYLQTLRRAATDLGLAITGVGALREVAAFAAQAGLRLGLENHNHGAFTQTAADQLRVLEEVGHPALGHLLDTGNYVDGWPSVERTAPLAMHVHAKFWTVAPDGAEPSIDYPKLVQMLRGRRYDGWVVFEYEAAEAEVTGIPRALDYLRRLVTQGA